jgi:hypothetical protein
VTLEIERPTPAATSLPRRTAEDLEEDRLAAARRREAALHIVVVSLFWLVSVPFTLGWGLLGDQPQLFTLIIAALLSLFLPFTAAVIATRHAFYFTAGCYAVLTLVMVIPAISMVRAG